VRGRPGIGNRFGTLSVVTSEFAANRLSSPRRYRPYTSVNAVRGNGGACPPEPPLPFDPLHLAGALTRSDREHAQAGSGDHAQDRHRKPCGAWWQDQLEQRYRITDPLTHRPERAVAVVSRHHGALGGQRTDSET